MLALFTVTTDADSGSGSLREAIQLSNANTDLGANAIRFAIPAGVDRTISLLSPLPAVTHSVALDGQSQPGYSDKPLIVLDGRGAGPGADGLRLVAGGNVIRGLAIGGFAADAGGVGGRGIVLSNEGRNAIQGCFIGTDATGQVAVPNRIGIESSSPGNTIGGTAADTGNVVSGNAAAGLSLLGANGGNNVVQGNYFGVANDGVSALSNGLGVLVATSNNLIGGGTAPARNVISGNTLANTSAGTGLLFDGPATGNLVQGNFVGLDYTGQVALPNTFGIRFSPQFVAVAGSAGNTIGGIVNTQGNFISGNALDGVALAGAINTSVLGNFIGLDAGGGAEGNGSNGVSVVVATGTPAPIALNNTIGGSAAGAGNLIRNNAGAGVLVDNVNGGPIAGVSIVGNYVSANGQLGIDIGADGVTPGYLFVTSATGVPGGVVTVSGVLHGAPNTTYRVDLFSNLVADPSGFGEGQSFLATTDPILTDALGNASFVQAFNGVTQTVFTATVTDAAGTTSEFSQAFPPPLASGRADLAVSLSGPSGTVPAGSRLTLTATITNNGPNAAAGVVFNDQLPSGLTLVSATSSVGVVTSDASGAIFASLGTLASGGSATITLVLTAAQTGTVSNAAGVFSTTFDTEYTNNQATQTVTVLPVVNPSADLRIGQTSFAPAGKVVGQNLVYTITVTNNGPSNATGVVVTSFLPDGQRFVDASSSQGFSSFSNDILTTNVGSLLIGGTATVTVRLVLQKAGPATNVANVSGGQIDLNIANNSSTLVDTIDAAALASPLALTQAASPSTGAVGQNLLLTLTVTNPNNVAASGVILVNTLPANARFVSATPSVGTYSIANGSLTANFGTMAPGASASIVLTLVPTGSGRIVSEAATIASTSPGATFTYSTQAIPIGGQGPTVTGVAAPGSGTRLTQVVVSFDTPLNAASARRKTNYRIYAIGGTPRELTRQDRPLPIKVISYNATTHQVTITLARPLPRSQFFRLVAVGTSSTGIKDLSGKRLNGTGTPGTNYTTTFFGIA